MELHTKQPKTDVFYRNCNAVTIDVTRLWRYTIAVIWRGYPGCFGRFRGGKSESFRKSRAVPIWPPTASEQMSSFAGLDSAHLPERRLYEAWILQTVATRQGLSCFQVDHLCFRSLPSRAGREQIHRRMHTAGGKLHRFLTDQWPDSVRCGCPWGIYAQSKNGVTPSGFVRPVFCRSRAANQGNWFI